jgi:threonine/homoserine/homoserine lactone efflux protein
MELHPYLLAALTGLGFGFILSVPVGPVNLTIMNEGARRGLGWAAMIGLGATAMEVIYCALAFTGFANFFDGKMMKAIMELTSFVFFLYLGMKFLTARKIDLPAESKFTQRFHPETAFTTGFMRVMGNPGVFLFWVFLAAMFRAHDWVAATWGGTASCVAGVACGTSIWFYGLSYCVSRGQGKFTEHTLLLMERVSGVCLLLMAVGQGVHIVWQMSRHTL